jgi:hypothetical protein
VAIQASKFARGGSGLYKTKPPRDGLAPFLQLSYDSSLKELVFCSDATVRLANCMISDPELGAMTIRHYLERPEAGFDRSLQTQNMGKKTAQELQELIRSFDRIKGGVALANLEEREIDAVLPAEPRDILASALRAFKFPDVLLDLDLSARLRGVLEKFADDRKKGRKPAASLATLADVVDRWSETAVALYRFKNFGRKSLGELKGFVEELLNYSVNTLWPQISLQRSIRIEDYEVEFTAEITRLLRGVDPAGATHIDLAAFESPSPAACGVREKIGQILGALTAKERDVLFRRYGLEDFTPMTLDEIGKKFYVTRERVRQVEAKAIRRLQIGSRVTAFRQLIAAEENALWNLLSEGSELLLPQDIDRHQREIDPLLQLALTIAFGDVRKWILAKGRPFVGGWVRSHRQPEDLQAIIIEVKTFLQSRPLPRSISGIAEALQIEPQDVIIAVKASDHLRVFEDYVAEGIVGAQARRTVRLHKLFIELQGDDLNDFAIVLAAYRLRYPDDDPASRIFDLQMARAPHLFVSMFDAVWLALPDSGIALRRGGSIRYSNSRLSLDRASDDETISCWLMAELYRCGPTRAVDLRDRAMREFDGQILATSIQAVMLMSPAFIRLAPGVFGLQEHLAALSVEGTAFPEAFFHNTHCRYYVMARKAKEPLNLYPAWNYGFEAELCSWSKRHSSSELFRSLLYVAYPDRWPATLEERKKWEAIQATYGSYKLSCPPAVISEARLPKETHILAALAFLGTLGGISVSLRRVPSSHLGAFG